MSRRELYTIPFVAILPAMPAIAQDRGATVIIGPEERDCLRQQEAALISGEIVVCGERSKDQERYRISSDDDAERRYASETREDGLALAPDFTPPPCKPNLLTWCPELGAPPPPAQPVDVTALPEPVAMTELADPAPGPAE